jgi:hypothetical protein
MHMREKTSSKLGLWLAMVPVLITAGCGSPMPARTVSYFQSHPNEREALYKRCADDPGTLGKTAACVNVEQAEAIEGTGSFRHLPPMHFPPIPSADAKKSASASGENGSTPK